jgi:hypothetical protein
MEAMADGGRLVAFVRLSADGVPSAGVTRVGDVDSTTEPVPVLVVVPVPPLAGASGPSSVNELNVGDGYVWAGAIIGAWSAPLEALHP